MTDVISGIHRGYYVMHHPRAGVTVSVPLRQQARKLEAAGVSIGGVETYDVIREMEGVQVGGKIFRKLKGAVKKGVSKTVNAAKKVAKNKLVKELYNAAKSAAPTPYKEGIAAAEVAARVTVAMSKGDKKAKKTIALGKKLALGQTTLAAAKKAAKAAGIKPTQVRDVAATMTLASSPNPEAQKIIAAAREIENAGLEQDERKFTLKGPSGKTYEVSVKVA